MKVSHSNATKPVGVASSLSVLSVCMFSNWLFVEIQKDISLIALSQMQFI